MARELGARGKLTVLGPAGCRPHLGLAPERVGEVQHRPLPWFLVAGAARCLRLAQQFLPEIVLAGSGLTAPLAVAAARLAHARSVVYLHGLDIIASSRIYQTIWLPCIRQADVVLVNSRNTGRLAEAAGVYANRIRIVRPGTDLPGRDPAAGQAFREQNGLGTRPLLLSVGRLTARKGLVEFVERALPRVLERSPETVLLVFGEDARDSINAERGSRLASIKAAVSAAGVAASVRFLPHCDDATLSAASSAVDVHVFPVRERPGDVEGFGMVAIEAAAHGLPTVAFSVGGVPDAVIENVTGSLVVPDDYTALAAAILFQLERREDAAYRRACFEAARRFGWDRFGDELERALT
jgi:phosphatidylinositol alpha-1,6-mannosyltransferase